MPRLCIYCGSSVGASPEYASAAAGFARACVRRGFGIVYGGGKLGLMGTVADSVLEAGGEIIGVMPQAMVSEGRAREGLSQFIVVESMHERKKRMVGFADAFVALPGGIGTLEEVIETYTWLQLGLHSKPVGLLNTCGFYDPLTGFLAQMKDQGFLTTAHYGMLTVAADPELLLDRLQATRHAPVRKP